MLDWDFGIISIKIKVHFRFYFNYILENAIESQFKILGSKEESEVAEFFILLQ